jgi:hypothetical protein
MTNTNNNKVKKEKKLGRKLLEVFKHKNKLGKKFF